MPNIDQINNQLYFDSSLYIAIENDYSSDKIKHKSISIARAAADSGCNIVQYRARNISYFKMLDEAKSIYAICAEQNIPLIINNHIDLALDINAAGVHLSAEDVSAIQTRAILGPHKIIGLTIRTAEDARLANLNALDYVTIAGIFATEKDLLNQTPLGIEGLKDILEIVKVRAPEISIVGMGGINEENAGQILETGIKCLGVISAISQSKKPITACKKLKKIIKKALK